MPEAVKPAPQKIQIHHLNTLPFQWDFLLFSLTDILMHLNRIVLQCISYHRMAVLSNCHYYGQYIVNSVLLRV